MIRAVGNKRLDLSDSEFSYFKVLKETFGESGFRGLFSTNKNGLITSVTPPLNNKVEIGIVYFILNVMLNQRVRILDDKVNNFAKIQEKIAGEGSVPNILERLDRIERAIFEEEDE